MTVVSDLEVAPKFIGGETPDGGVVFSFSSIYNILLLIMIIFRM